MRLIYTILASIIIFSCDSNHKRIKSHDLKAVNRIAEINDTLFVTDGITELYISEDYSYISDKKLGANIVLNRDLELINIFNHGDAPNETGIIYNAQIIGDTVYQTDYTKLILSKFKYNDTTLYSKKLKNEEFIGLLYKNSIDPYGNYYIFSYLYDRPILKINRSSDIISNFGIFKDSDDDRHKRATNTQNIIYNNGNVFSIWTSIPLIQKYSMDGELLSEFDLSEILDFRLKKYQSMIEKNPSLKNRLQFALYNDIYAHENKLFLLFIGDYEIPNSNQILVLDLSTSKIQIEAILNLNTPGAFFKQIAISGSRLWAYDRAGAEIIEFKIDL